jgi:hypothetical protein
VNIKIFDGVCMRDAYIGAKEKKVRTQRFLSIGAAFMARAALVLDLSLRSKT